MSNTLDLCLTGNTSQNSTVSKAFDQSKALYNARVEADFQQQWIQAGGPQFMAQQFSYNRPQYPQGPHSQHQPRRILQHEHQNQSPIKKPLGSYDSSCCISQEPSGSRAGIAIDDLPSMLADTTGQHTVPTEKSPVNQELEPRQRQRDLRSVADNVTRPSVTKRKRNNEESSAVAASISVEEDKHERLSSKKRIRISAMKDVVKKSNEKPESHYKPIGKPEWGSTKGTLVPRLQKARPSNTMSGSPVTRSQKKEIHTSPEILNAKSHTDPAWHGIWPQTPASLTNPFHGCLSLDSHALVQGSTRARENELLPPLRTRSLSRPNPYATASYDLQANTDHSEQPNKILVDESEIDFDAPDSEIENVVQRPQKKDTSQSVAHRSMGTDKKLKGEVRKLKDGSGRAFKDQDNPQWTKGEYHYKLRASFIDADESRHPPYFVEPAKGLGKTDVTSFSTDQRNWTFNPDSVQDPQGTKLLAPDYRPKAFTEKDPPDWILEDGTVVLDLNGHPVRKFRNIPSTLSSAIEPWRMEGLRALNGMRVPDLMARMPKYCETPDGKLEPLQGPSAFTNRARNWRDIQGIKPLKKGRPRIGLTQTSKSEQGDQICSDLMPSHKASFREPAAFQQNVDSSAPYSPAIFGQSAYLDSIHPKLQAPDVLTSIDNTDFALDNIKHGLNVEEADRAGHIKRWKVGGKTRLDNENGTTAQRATNQTRQNKAKKRPSFKPNRSNHDGDRQTTPLLSSGVINQPQRNPYLLSNDGGFSGSQPNVHPYFCPLVGDNEGFGWDNHPIPQTIAEPNNLYQCRFLPQEPNYQSDLASTNAMDRFMDRSSTGLTVPAVSPDFPTQYPSLWSPPPRMTYDAPYAQSGDGVERSPQMRGIQGPMLGDCNGSQQWSLPGRFNPVDDIYGPDASLAQGSPPRVTSSIQVDGHNDPNLPATTRYDFRGYAPLYEIEVIEIEAALHRTRQCFEEAHPFDAVPPTAWLSYDGARAVLEVRHRELCDSHGQRVTPLAGLGPWHETLDNWPSAKEI